jgi:hypothetical protein
MPLVRFPAKYTSLQSTKAYSRAAAAREHGLAVKSSSELPIAGVELAVTPVDEVVLGRRSENNDEDGVASSGVVDDVLETVVVVSTGRTDSCSRWCIH